jgi:parvulin-like peptidyl-prolyl isomerase
VTETSRPIPSRPLVALALSLGAAIPLGCKDNNAIEPPPTTQKIVSTSTGPGGEKVKTVEVIREKIVYVDRPVAPSPQPKEEDPVLATVGSGNRTQTVKLSDIKDILVKSYGLNATLNCVQLKLAQAEARSRGLTISKSDIDRETELTLAQVFPDAQPNEYPDLLKQLLQQQKLSRPEFDLVMEVNANLRKIAESQLAPESQVKEETLREAFNVLYGETVKVRHIALSNMQEVLAAQKQLAAGVPFRDVARAMSKNGRTAPLDGELPAFSRAASDVTPAFKDAAFALKEGEVSEPVQAEGYYHLIKLEKRIPPKAVRFEDVRDSIARDLRKKATDAAVRQFRQTLGDQARQTLKIEEPTLAEQWRQRVESAEKNASGGGNAVQVAPR